MVCTAPDVIGGRVQPRGESIVVVGSGMTGLETAEILSERERNNAVVVMESSDKLAPGILGSNRNVVTAVLELNNVVFMIKRRLTKVAEDRIFFCDSVTGEEYSYPCDRVVLAVGIASKLPYGDSLATVCDNVQRIGDAGQPGKIWQAIHSADLVARKL